jgi:hypothetical protein
MNAAVILLALCAATGPGRNAPPGGFPKTQPSSWGAGGWEEFRWGMGPGDVLLRAKPAPGGRFLETRTPDLVRHKGVLDRDLFGRSLQVEFGFANDRLVDILITDSPLNTQRALSDLWFKRIRRVLDEKYGAGTCGAEELSRCAWTSGTTRIELYEFPVDKGVGTYLHYADEARARMPAAIERAEKQKL